MRKDDRKKWKAQGVKRKQEKPYWAHKRNPDGGVNIIGEGHWGEEDTDSEIEREDEAIR